MGSQINWDEKMKRLSKISASIIICKRLASARSISLSLNLLLEPGVNIFFHLNWQLQEQELKIANLARGACALAKGLQIINDALIFESSPMEKVSENNNRNSLS